MQDLSTARSLEVDRREFYCQVEAFAGLVVLNIVPLAGELLSVFTHEHHAEHPFCISLAPHPHFAGIASGGGSLVHLVISQEVRD